MEASSPRDTEVAFAELTQEAPAVTHHTLAQATVVGQGTVISTGDRIVCETTLEFLASGNVPDGLERAGDGPGMLLKTATEVVVERPSLLVKRPWAQNFGHFLVDAAALVTLADRLTLPPDWQIIITRFDDPRLRETAPEVMSMLAPGVTVVEHPDAELWRIRNLHYVSPVNLPPMTKRPETLAMLRTAMVRKHRDRPANKRRIFVSRRPGAVRTLGVWSRSVMVQL